MCGQVICNAIAVESRLCQPALAAVLVSFAQQYAFAEETPGTLPSSAFEEVVIVIDQNVAHVVRMIYKEDVFQTDAETTHIAVRVRETQHEVQRVAAAFIYERAEESISAWAGDWGRACNRLGAIVSCGRQCVWELG